MKHKLLPRMRRIIRLLPSSERSPAVVPLHTYQEGSGPVVLLLHGLGSSGADWPLQMAALCPHFQVIAPDLRGHGQSPLPPGLPAIADYTRDVLALLDGLDVEQTQVVGLSMGGAVALQMALEAPQRVSRLVLVNTAASFQVHEPAMVLRGAHRLALMRFKSMQAMCQAIANGLFPYPEQEELRTLLVQRMGQGNPRAYQLAMMAIARFDVRRRLECIHCPTLVVAGREDRTVSMSSRLYLAAHIPGAHLVIVPGSGHATPIDQAERFNCLLLSFLNDHE